MNEPAAVAALVATGVVTVTGTVVPAAGPAGTTTMISELPSARNGRAFADPKLTAEAFKGSPIEVEYRKLSPTPDEFPNFVKRLLATASKGHDIGADKLKATTAPMFFIHGDADGIRLEHVAEMFRLKGGEIHGDMRPRSASRLAILPDTTHVTLMQRMAIIVPMVNDFLDAKPQKQ